MIGQGFRIFAALAAALLLSAPGAAAAVSTMPAVSVLDPHDVLSDQDEELLRADARDLDLPESVSTVTYVAFERNDDNLNDTVEREIRASRPDLIADNDDAWAPGALIFAYGRDPRRSGVYCGDDMCAQFDLFHGNHLDRTREAMHPAFTKGNITAGFLEGTRYAVDSSVIAMDRAEERKEKKNDNVFTKVFIAVGGLGLLALVAAIIRAVQRYRRNQERQAAEDYEYVMLHYAEIAQRLDGIDVRANSLTSELANDQLRREWAEVRDRFLQLHESLVPLAEPKSDNAQQYAELRETVEQLLRAESNIDSLWEMEHGNQTQRRRELDRLYDDAVRAETNINGHRLQERLRGIQQRITDLKQRTAAADFMDTYAGIVHDYGVVLQLVREEELVQPEAFEPPKLYDSTYRIGTGYANFLPFAVMYTQYTQTMAVSSGYSPGVSTTSFSSGFSGGGGSGNF